MEPEGAQTHEAANAAKDVPSESREPSTVPSALVTGSAQTGPAAKVPVVASATIPAAIPLPTAAGQAAVAGSVISTQASSIPSTARASSRGSVRVGSVVIPCVPQEPTSRGGSHPLPQAWAFGRSGGSLPCAQSWQPVRTPTASPYPQFSGGAWPCTPRAAVPGTQVAASPAQAPQVATPQVVVVRELSPGRPLAHPSVAQRALSPGVPPAVVSQPIPSPQALQGQMSPGFVFQPRALSPSRPAAVWAAPAQMSPRQPPPNRLQSSPPPPMTGRVTLVRERSLSPPSLPPAVGPVDALRHEMEWANGRQVPVFQAVPRAMPHTALQAVPGVPAEPLAPSEPQASRCLSPRPVVVKQATPRAPSAPRTVIRQVVTPRGQVGACAPAGVATPGRVLEGLRASAQRQGARTTWRMPVRKGAVRSSSAAGGVRTAPSVVPPGRAVKGCPSQEPICDSHLPTAAGQLPRRIPSAPSRAQPAESPSTAAAEMDPRFIAFRDMLSEPGGLEATCQQLLTRLQAGSSVRWEELVNLNPITTLLEIGAGVASSPTCSRKAVHTAYQEDGEEVPSCRGWWRALLARHSLYGPGDVLGAAELSELVGVALRFLRDRYAPQAFLRNLRTVHCGSKRLKELYGSFEFHSRGMMGKSYRCRSRLTREEHICRQVCKDKVPAPSDVVRAEVEILRSLEHPTLPQVIASFEDFNNIYIVLEPVESVELVNVLQQWHQTGQGLSVGWLAVIARQLLEAFRHCHELRPRSLVHGDLRLTSLLLSAMTDAKAAPQLVLADLGLAGLPSAPREGKACGPGTGQEDWSQCPSPLLDVWSCGCLFFMLLSGHHPFSGDPGGRLVPSVSRHEPPEPDWRMLPSASSASLCAQMLSWDVKARPTAAECLRHSWLSADDSHNAALPMEALGNLLKSHHKSKLQEITAGLAISEQITSPFSAVGAALALQHAFSEGEATPGAQDVAATVPLEKANEALAKLGMSAKGIDKVLKAFVDDQGVKVSSGLLISHCSELAEDLLDHALWRVFTAAGEDHRGVLGAAELEKALAESAEGGADKAGGEPESAGGPFGELKASDIVRQIASGSQQVTFEELKGAVIQRQSAAYTKAASPVRTGA
ncbi:unnamed protein product [Effrenium voratum]|nr:unnamed protein product [Effrenium voratum]